MLSGKCRRVADIFHILWFLDLRKRRKGEHVMFQDFLTPGGVNVGSRQCRMPKLLKSPFS